MNPWLYLLPILSALLAGLCIRIAGTVLFKSILPRRRDRLVDKIAETIASRFSFEGIKERITDPGSVKHIMPVVEDHIDHFLRHKLKEKMPMIGMLIGDKTINSLKEVFLKEIEELFPAVLSKFAGNLEKEFDLRKTIHEKLSSIPLGRIQKAFSPIQTYFEVAAMLAGLLCGLLAIAGFFLLD